VEADRPGARRRRRAGERRLVRAELVLLLDDLVELEAQAEYDGAGQLSLTIAQLARRAISAGYLTDVELGRMVLEAGSPAA
jgi:hypothetical protein